MDFVNLLLAVAKYCDEYVCMCVCMSVCPQAHFRNHTRDLYLFFVHVAYGCGSVFLWQGDKILMGSGNSVISH